MTGIGDNGAVFHHLKVMLVKHVDIAGEGDENIADLGCFIHRHDPETIHHCFQSCQGVDLGHDDLCAHAARAEAKPRPHQP